MGDVIILVCSAITVVANCVTVYCVVRQTRCAGAAVRGTEQ